MNPARNACYLPLISESIRNNTIISPNPLSIPTNSLKPTHAQSISSNMPPKSRIHQLAPPPPGYVPPPPKQPQAAKSSGSSTSKASANSTNAQDIIQGVWNKYVKKTPQRVKLLDTFMVFLVVVGALQFVYCVLVGNFPFNAFLSGFSATVGQFVLTASLRIQTNPDNKIEFETISHERAFADYIFGSLLLHFFCVNFIN
ncbi:DAD-domain-containing protein [Pleomassaria siparia CBS 279.74]|uniref:Dolichyl-diphosphooligosaccharide--protein glycosyltransferase subunit OST2 n=1 Tax=Pleomassaria siparia CBS 279.74 TaxID=1314801 RepID=A0A6G1JY02_9PLEO|nr:DAD-domain-containing protein [Pleomassaria siparia CBS 279.74]